MDDDVTAAAHGASPAPSARSEEKYTVTFERIGRDHCVPPLIAEIAEPSELGEEIADAVLRRARKYLRSSDYEVFVNLEEMRGFIVVGGFRSGGTFTIALDQPRGLSASEGPTSPEAVTTDLEYDGLRSNYDIEEHVIPNPVDPTPGERGE